MAETFSGMRKKGLKIISMYKNSFSELLQIYFEKLFSNDGIVIFNFDYEIDNKNNDIEKSTIIDIDIGQVDVFNFNMSYEEKFQMYTKSISL